MEEPRASTPTWAASREPMNHQVVASMPKPQPFFFASPGWPGLAGSEGFSAAASFEKRLRPGMRLKRLRPCCWEAEAWTAEVSVPAAEVMVRPEAERSAESLAWPNRLLS